MGAKWVCSEKKKMKLIDEVIEWANEAEISRLHLWKSYCALYLKSFGWNPRAIESFVDWGDGGFNNKLLHFSNSYKDFYSEVLYASDRMSMDRLFRCHSKWRNINDASLEITK